jgi:hypothetical protein
MKAQNLSTSLGEGRDVAPSLALPSQNPNLTVYTEELTHLKKHPLLFPLAHIRSASFLKD